MPIRINLLAEEQAAEEMRRRDPVKRALYIGSLSLLLMLAWIGITQLEIFSARSELATTEGRLRKIEEASKQVRSEQLALAETEFRLRGLEKYSENRFLWGTFLDQIQRVSVEPVRFMEVRADQKYSLGEPAKLFATNLNVKCPAPPAAWKFWARRETAPPLATLAEQSLAGVTNRTPFTTNLVEYNIKVSPVATNKSEGTVLAQAEFTTVAWAKEHTQVELRGRDYGNPPGAAIDVLARQIHASPYFQHGLEPESEAGFRFTERPPQARPDPQDAENPNALFVPFTIELTLKERVLTSE